MVSRRSLHPLLHEHTSQLSHLIAVGHAIDEAVEELQETHAALLADHKELQDERCQLQEECKSLRIGLAMMAAGGLCDVLQLPELALAVGSSTGCVAATRISQLSKCHQVVMSKVIPRLKYKMPPDLYVFGGKNDTSQALATVERVNTCTGIWQPLPPMLTPRYGCAAAALGGQLYVVGGHNGKHVVDAAERFNPGTHLWESLPAMLNARSRCAAAAVGGMLYVVGGHDGRQGGTNVERFCPSLGYWTLLPTMPVDTMGCVAAVMDGKLCVIGTSTDRQMLVELFDPERLCWETLPTAPCQRFGCAAAAVSGSLYIVGGHDGQAPVDVTEKLVLVADVSTSEAMEPTSTYSCDLTPDRGYCCPSSCSALWETVTPIPTPRHGCAATSADGMLYVVGGDDGRSMPTSLGAVEYYDPIGRKWVALGPLPTGRFGCAAAAVWQ